jgi:CRP-like cAMP-binding protein
VLASALTANIFEQDPTLLAGMSAADAASVTEIREARVVAHPAGAVDLAFERHGGFGLLVLEGFLCRIVEVAGRTSVEVLGRGDVLRPWDDTRAQGAIPVMSAFRALTPVRLAVLDRAFVQAVAPWPAVGEAISARLIERARWLAFQLAITRERRIEDRLYLLLWQLADRWGRAEHDGAVVCSIRSVMTCWVG